MSHSFLEFPPYSGNVEGCSYGALISMAKGEALRYNLNNLQERGGFL